MNKKFSAVSLIAMTIFMVAIFATSAGQTNFGEADKFGLHYMVENGYRASQMVRVMEILQQTMGNNRQSEYASSHPSPENRIIKLKEEMAKMGVADN